MPAEHAPAGPAPSPDGAARLGRYTRLRWVGVALFCVAVPVACACFGAWWTGRAPGRAIPLGLLSLGLSLGAFGTNDDAALRALADLARRGAVSEAGRRELADEHARRPGRVATLHDHPTASLVMPVLAAAVVGGAAWYAAGAWGLLA